MTISMIMARLCSFGRSTQEVLMTLQTPRAIRRLEESMPILPINSSRTSIWKIHYKKFEVYVKRTNVTPNGCDVSSMVSP